MSALEIIFAANNSSRQPLVVTSQDGSGWNNNIATGEGCAEYSGPCITRFGASMVVAWSDAGANLRTATSSSPGALSASSHVTGNSHSSPSLCEHQGRVYCANTYGATIQVRSSADGLSWSSPSSIPVPALLGACAIASHAGRLHAAYIGVYGLQLSASDDGSTWDEPLSLGGSPIIGTPALASFKGRLRLAYVTNGHRDLVIRSSEDGKTWGDSTPVADHRSNTSPTLTSYGDNLFLAYTKAAPDALLLVVSSSDGTSWSGDTVVNGESVWVPDTLNTVYPMLSMAVRP